MDKPFWGKGHATEAARASLQFGSDQLGFYQLIALVHPENTGSRWVLDKCGMTYIETIRLWGMDLLRYITEETA